MPEVNSASFGSAQPGDSSSSTRVQFTGAPIPVDPDSPPFGQSWIDTTYFQSMGINLQQGRYFDLGDNLGSEPVVIVDNAFIEAMGFSNSVVGQSIQLLGPEAGSAEANLDSDGLTSLRIVGVVPSIREVEGRPKPKLYRPLDQHSSDSQPLETLFLFAEFALPEGAAADQAQLIDMERAIKLAGASINRDVSLHTFLSLSSALEKENSAVRGMVTFFSTAALVALLLAVIGVYGMISRAVIARTNEIGIRRAIGSNNSSIIGIFLKQGMSTLVVGGVLGGGAAVLGISAMGDQSAFIDLYGAIPLAFMSVTTIISVLVFYASYMPVRRIIGMEPGEALHYE
jgi:ABC-type antimicrobial peptide transport system permease subunit